MDSVRSVFEDAKGDGGAGDGIWGVFAVLVYPGLGKVADGEEAQGKVSHEFIYPFLVFLVFRSTFPMLTRGCCCQGESLRIIAFQVFTSLAQSLDSFWTSAFHWAQCFLLVDQVQDQWKDQD